MTKFTRVHILTAVFATAAVSLTTMAGSGFLAQVGSGEPNTGTATNTGGFGAPEPAQTNQAQTPPAPGQPGIPSSQMQGATMDELKKIFQENPTISSFCLPEPGTLRPEPNPTVCQATGKKMIRREEIGIPSTSGGVPNQGTGPNTPMGNQTNGGNWGPSSMNGPNGGMNTQGNQGWQVNGPQNGGNAGGQPTQGMNQQQWMMPQNTGPGPMNGQNGGMNQQGNQGGQGNGQQNGWNNGPGQMGPQSNGWNMGPAPVNGSGPQGQQWEGPQNGSGPMGQGWSGGQQGSGPMGQQGFGPGPQGNQGPMNFDGPQGNQQGPGGPGQGKPDVMINGLPPIHLLSEKMLNKMLDTEIPEEEWPILKGFLEEQIDNLLEKIDKLETKQEQAEKAGKKTKVKSYAKQVKRAQKQVDHAEKLLLIMNDRLGESDTGSDAADVNVE